MEAPQNDVPEVHGPRRKAPTYYAGETYGRRRMLYPDVERYANGTVRGIRDKAARRLIRKMFGLHFSRVEKGLRLARAMQAQAREVADDADRSNRWGRRLYDKELAIHQAAHNVMTRSEKRKLKRAGKKDAITQLVERMAGEKK